MTVIGAVFGAVGNCWTKMYVSFVFYDKVKKLFVAAAQAIKHRIIR
jgi:hypothetical protein